MAKTSRWNRLDNAAKIFPSTSRNSDTKVFRFACELFEAVDPAVLSEALYRNLADFPVYRSVLKRGLFWYYLEDSDLPAVCHRETLPVCSSIYDRNVKNLLFNVSYYEKRINLEVYHALSDGTGALEFLRHLVYHYLTIKYQAELKALPNMDFKASDEQKTDDSFAKYYTKSKRVKKIKSPHAYKIRGMRLSEDRMRVTEGVMSVSAVLEKAREYDVSLTVFLSAVFIDAIHKNMKKSDEKRAVVLNVPVNLRNYFASQSARNFFGVMNAGYDFKTGDGSFEDILRALSEEFKKNLTPESVKSRMDNYLRTEHNVFARATPLIFKDVFMRAAHDWINKEATGSVSNIGKITMPEELSKYIRLFDIFVSTDRVQICLCSYQDNLTVSMTSPLVSTGIACEFFRKIAGLGIPVEISDNRME